MVLKGGIAGSTCFWFIVVIFYSGVNSGFQIPLSDSFLNGGLYVYQMVCMVTR
ncbi:MAG: hypothetical protein HFH66_08580 [Lachnospiraceae bacterium]|nr:hypothetical protein [Lachnospiraceae bacterium]